jgi:hypothetical protein
MLTKNIEIMLAEVDQHIAADAVIQGDYWKNGRGCSIGCLAHSDDATVLQERFGIPLALVRICEDIFEALPADDAKVFFAEIPRAIGRDGKDLSRVHWQFLAAELRALPTVPAEIQAVIDPVIAGMDMLASGQPWDKDTAARAAAYAANTAARAAAYAANTAARAAAYAANAAAYVARAAYAAADAARAAYAADAANAARAAYAAYDTARLRQRDTILQLMRTAPY